MLRDFLNDDWNSPIHRPMDGQPVLSRLHHAETTIVQPQQPGIPKTLHHTGKFWQNSSAPFGHSGRLVKKPVPRNDFSELLDI